MSLKDRLTVVVPEKDIAEDANNADRNRELQDAIDRLKDYRERLHIITADAEELARIHLPQDQRSGLEQLSYLMIEINKQESSGDSQVDIPRIPGLSESESAAVKRMHAKYHVPIDKPEIESTEVADAFNRIFSLIVTIERNSPNSETPDPAA